jgi:hypothetical protein
VNQKWNSRGRFKTGYSGNAGGRPKDEHKVAELARSFTIEAIDTLVELMRNAKDERVKGTAAQVLLDRGWGKPRVEVLTNQQPDSYITALESVSSRLDASEQPQRSRLVQAATPRN